MPATAAPDTESDEWSRWRALSSLLKQAHPAVPVCVPRVLFGAQARRLSHPSQVFGGVNEPLHYLSECINISNWNEVTFYARGDQVRCRRSIGGNNRHAGGQCFQQHQTKPFEVTWQHQYIALPKQSREFAVRDLTNNS